MAADSVFRCYHVGRVNCRLINENIQQLAVCELRSHRDIAIHATCYADFIGYIHPPIFLKYITTHATVATMFLLSLILSLLSLSETKQM